MPLSLSCTTAPSQQAREAEQEIHAGNWRGPLHGIPIGLKDLIDTAGVKTTCGSALFADRVPTEDAEIVRRLKRAGAVLIGKQNMQEFAYGGTSTSSYFGPVHNPWDIDRIAGGSSGGSAAAVAAGMCFSAIGTDTGGSVREPAAFCGIVGSKTDVWPRECTWCVSTFAVAGPCRTSLPQRHRHCPDASSSCWL